MKWGLAFCLLAVSTTVGAVVIRADVDDARYRIPASAIPALADLPGEGHGVLIAPRWVVTATHAISWQMSVDEVTIGGKPRMVAKIIKYPGFTRLPDAMAKEALASGDFSKVHTFLSHRNDITLIELASPVTGVAPMSLYRGSDEKGKAVEIVGKGATGNGLTGIKAHASHHTALRRAYNVVTGTSGRWLWYTFDAPPAALPLEGISGSGDSGGPVILDVKGKKELAGLTSWIKYPGGLHGEAGLHGLKAGFYGEISYDVRISHYAGWIEKVISAHPVALRKRKPEKESRARVGESERRIG